MPSYLSEHVYITNGGQTDFTFNKGYLSRSHVEVKVSADSAATFALKVDPTHYSWVDSQTIRFLAAPALNSVLWLDRVTPRTIDLTYTNGSVFTDVSQNYDYRQPMYILQEMLDDLSRRPALNVEFDSVEETLANVMGDLTLNGSNLVKETFDLKATLGLNASGILTVALSKLNQASAAMALPGAFGARQGGIRISNFTANFFGEIEYDTGGGPVNIADNGIVGVNALAWDGTLPFWRHDGSDNNCFRAFAGPNPYLPSVLHLKLKTGAGSTDYARLLDSTAIYHSGANWLLDILVYGIGGDMTIQYSKPTNNDATGAMTFNAAGSNGFLVAAGFSPPPINVEIY